MSTLMRAHTELIRRSPDEHFPSFQALWDHCRSEAESSTEHWRLPQDLVPTPMDDGLALDLPVATPQLNAWSFSQLCGLAGVNAATMNRLRPGTSAQAFAETLPDGSKPLQVYASPERVRAIHPASYTRLQNSELLSLVREFATDFRPPQEAAGGGSGLYCGEQDMFVFLIDPTGWVEIKSEVFAPGFFLWNSEVGARTVGIQSFWFQKVCQNHIVWDATDVVEFSRRHTSNVRDALPVIRTMIEQLVEKRDKRRDAFAKQIAAAMKTQVGTDEEVVLKMLRDHGIRRKVAKQSLELARASGGFTLFNLVDALTRLSQQSAFAGERAESDVAAAKLLTLAAT